MWSENMRNPLLDPIELDHWLSPIARDVNSGLARRCSPLFIINRTSACSLENVDLVVCNTDAGRPLLRHVIQRILVPAGTRRGGGNFRTAAKPRP